MSGVISAALRELVAAGVTGDALVSAVERIEAALVKRSSGAERTARWREKERHRDVTPSQNVTDKAPSKVPPITPLNTPQGSEPKGSGASAPSDPKTDLFRRGREVLGKEAGSLIAKLLRSIGKEDDPKVIAKARSRIEEASTKVEPIPWITKTMAPRQGEFRTLSGMDGII